MMQKMVCLLSFLLMMILNLAGQHYSFSTLTEPYTPLADAVDLTQGEPWQQLHYTVQLEHSFEFYGQTFDTIHIRGYIHFDQADTYFINPFFTLFADRGNSQVLFKTEGNPGNRITKIEWRNMGFWAEAHLGGTLLDYVSFQLWLHEGTNTVSIRIGNNSVSNPDTSYYGKTGPAVGVYHIIQYNPEIQIASVSLSGNPTSPTTVFNDPSLQTFLEGTPVENTVYRFSYTPGHIHEYADIRLLLYPNPASQNMYLQTSEMGSSQEDRKSTRLNSSHT